MHMKRCLVTLTILFACINTTLALDGSGEESDPWLIQSPTDFDDFTANSDYWDDYTRLETDINLTGKSYTAAPIAPDTDNVTDDFQGIAFTGTFNGNGHTISNFTINGGYYVGLFGYIDKGSVLNLGVENIDISGSGDYIGGLCGSNFRGYTTNCYSTGTATGGDYVGGLCGHDFSGSIISCYSTVNISGSRAVGGLVGGTSYYGSISNCYATGNITATGDDPDYFGGLVGGSTSEIGRAHV